MAKQRSSPNGPPDKDSFLGGGVQFNKVGTSIPGASSAAPDESPIVTLPPAQARAGAVRTTVIVAALLLLVILLFLLSNDTLSGVQHTVGRGGVSSTAHTPTPPRNF